MEGYLGTTVVDISTHPEFSKYSPSDWAMHYIYVYGGIDGAHHKQWLLDQVARLLCGAVPEITLAKWENGHEEYRYGSVNKTDEYLKFVTKCQDPDEDGEPQYDYDEGWAP